MKTKILFFAMLTFLTVNVSKKAYSQVVWTVGPMLHINFGDKQVKASFAIEAAYWNFYFIPYSLDAGIEFEKQKIRVYSEFQTGIGLAGGSIGPVFEFNTKEINVKGGIQASLWANYFIGFDLRYRRIGGKEFIAPGVYAKLPVYFYDKDDPDGENRNNNSSAADDILDIIF
jgi:hypothetical protein